MDSDKNEEPEEEEEEEEKATTEEEEESEGDAENVPESARPVLGRPLA
jgi:hypothetical protein